MEINYFVFWIVIGLVFFGLGLIAILLLKSIHAIISDIDSRYDISMKIQK